ncbi:hypothetical protein VNI00_012608 [Paramarasmius palmivorus]|uniref:Uncharacterized protein n=1 Tax=Paramarasmius palmivorus TaxID=297713 RepID=A0AAW0C593_9AGAR
MPLHTPFERKITDYFASVPKPVGINSHNGRRQYLAVSGVSVRIQLSDLADALARFGIMEQPQLGFLSIDGASYSWGHIGWKEYFDLPVGDTPLYFHATNDPLPNDWNKDVAPFLDAL